MYVASQSDKDWLQSVQRKLYTRSKNDLDYVFDKLWGLILARPVAATKLVLDTRVV
jgi:hypothetical protein